MINGSQVADAFHRRTSAGGLAPRLSCNLLIRPWSQTFSSCLCGWSVRGAQAHGRAVCYGATSSS
jgi:hypothetical protein